MPDAIVTSGSLLGRRCDPPQFVKEIIENAEELHVHDDWTQMMLKTGKYKSSDIYPRPHDPELLKQYEDKNSIRGKRLIAGWSNDYLMGILKSLAKK